MSSLREVVEKSKSNAQAKTVASAFKSDSKKNQYANWDKNKMISAYVNIENYEKFTAINKKRGFSNNKILNLIISDYVIEYEKIL